MRKVPPNNPHDNTHHQNTQPTPQDQPTPHNRTLHSPLSHTTSAPLTKCVPPNKSPNSAASKPSSRSSTWKARPTQTRRSTSIACTTTSPPDEPEDDVADENYYIGWEFGYGRPDLRNYVFENDEVRAAAEQYLRDFWPVERSFGDDESERVCEDEDGDDEGGDEGGQAAGGDGDGERVRTNTDTINPAGASAAGASATEEDEVSTISRYTNPDAFVAPTPANTPTLRFARLPTNNNATARAVQGEIAMNRHTNTDNPFAPTPANTPTQRSFRFVANNTASARAVQAHND